MNDIREAAYPGGNFVSTGSVTLFFNLKMKIFSFVNEIGIDEGYALAWQFNPCLSLEVQRRFRNLILR
jgi:hypothetical protein